MISASPMGVFGGIFDPIHYGHLRTAFELLQALRFDEVRFVPCGSPPHRIEPIADAELRLQMIELAIEGQSGFVVDDRELRRDGPSYSIDTLIDLREEFPDRPLGLIIGMDEFLGLPKWYRWQGLFELAHIVVARRPGWPSPDVGPIGDLLNTRGTSRIEKLHEKSSGHIYIHDVTQLEIASSEIRELIAVGRDPRFLMPDSVRDLIAQSGCYATAKDGQSTEFEISHCRNGE